MTPFLRTFDLIFNITNYNPSNILARAHLISTRHVTEYSPAKMGEYLKLLKTVSLDNAIREFSLAYHQLYHALQIW